MRQDEEHLRILAILHYVLGAFLAMGGFFPIIHLALGVAMVRGELGQGKDAPPPAMGWMFIGVAAAAMVMMWALAIGLLVAGQSLQARRRWTFCVVIAAVCCLHTPLGTILGVFTLIVLMRPSVKALFSETPFDPEERELEYRERPRPRREPDDRITE